MTCTETHACSAAGVVLDMQCTGHYGYDVDAMLGRNASATVRFDTGGAKNGSPGLHPPSAPSKGTRTSKCPPLPRDKGYLYLGGAQVDVRTPRVPRRPSACLTSLAASRPAQRA